MRFFTGRDKLFYSPTLLGEGNTSLMQDCQNLCKLQAPDTVSGRAQPMETVLRFYRRLIAFFKGLHMLEYGHVQDIQGNPIMPTTRHGWVRRALHNGKAKIVSIKSFTIKLTYELKIKETQSIIQGGRNAHEKW